MNDNKDSKPKKPKKKSDDNQKVAELTADLQRLQAEFINYKNRTTKDKEFAVEFGKEQAVSSLLPILDNLERAIAHEPADIKEHPWVKGVGAVVKQLESQLKAIGLVKIGKIGEEFNPDYHEAVSMQDGEGDQEVIIGLAQTGYTLDGRVIRHAIVQVGKK
jgi:molecular chaperone GrpE